MKFIILGIGLNLLILLTPLQAHPFPFDPPKNFTLRADYVVVHHPVSTSKVCAQQFFDQGLTLMYAFNHDAAYWSFLRSTEADPDFAMGYWGMALALGQNINMDITHERQQKAFSLIQKAKNLMVDRPEVERDYIEALSKRYSNDPNPNLPKLAKDYSLAMKELTRKYPDDPDAAVLTAESILDLNPWRNWTKDGVPLEGTLDAVHLLESVLARMPEHLGANHYYIHAVEASKNPEKALMSATRLSSLMPASGHILHMPSHIYLLVGDYYKAALANEEAAAIDRQYIKDYGLDGIYPLHYLSHNLYFMSRAYSMAGNYAKAIRAAQELERLYAPHYAKMPDLEYYVPTSMFAFLRFHRWSEILDLPEPQGQMLITKILWHFARSMAFSNLGYEQDAMQESQLFFEISKQVNPEMIYGYNRADKVVKIAQYLLKAKLAENSQKFEEASLNYQLAIAAQDDLSYNEPPDWFFPVRESLGGFLLRRGQFYEAEQVFREELVFHPKNGRSLFGLKEALKAQHKSDDYYWVNQEFQKAWLYSDSYLTLSDL